MITSDNYHSAASVAQKIALTAIVATFVFRHACKLGPEGIRVEAPCSPYRSGRSRHWIKSKNPAAPALKREAEEDWAR